jgi:G3E family GTPase
MLITRAVPTNIITGFLGVGKTTAILHLLSHKPANERWAVLVNEFGEVGIDGGLISGRQRQDKGVFIREVPGGCMCCAAGLPMQIALNRLLATAKPDRLLIEPTGLGHPKEVIEVLTQPHYTSIIHLYATITLIDPRKLRDTRYTEHDIFNQQIAVADVIVANKSDQYSDEDFASLGAYLTAHDHERIPIHPVSFGQIPFALLTTPTGYRVGPPNKHSHSLLQKTTKSNDIHHSDLDRLDTTQLQTGEHLTITNRGEGYISVGWRFHASVVFNHDKLFTFLTGISVRRLKAFFITDVGVFGYNLSDHALTEMELDDVLESRLECIDTHEDVLEGFEYQLLACQNETA